MSQNTPLRFEDVWKRGDPVMNQVWRAVMEQTHWRGVPMYKFPTDAMVYQMLIHELRPDVVIEIGTKFGGSALMFANMLDLIGDGTVVSVDRTPALINRTADAHPKTRFIKGDATDPNIVNHVRIFTKTRKSALIIEDAAHTYDCTRECLELYSPLVQPGGYYVVEDAMLCKAYNRGERGPLEAIHDFLREHPEWEMDRDREMYVMTSAAQGFLRRKA